ncbi:retrovirus-related pol polyprotein from transposon TNT 1-94 [Tanacetum coccineum]
MRPFGCPVTILNTIDHLGKFDSKADEGFFVGYSLNSKAFRVFNSRTRIVEENLHIRFSENTPNVLGSGPDWLFDIYALTRTMNYEPIVAGTQSNGFADDGSKPSSDDGKKVDEDSRKDNEGIDQEKEDNVNSTNNVNASSTNEVNVVGGKTSIELPLNLNMPELEDYNIFDSLRNDKDDDVATDMNNFDTTIQVSPNLTTRIHKDHPLDQVIGDLQSATQTRRMSKSLEEHGKNPKRNKKDKRGIMIRIKQMVVKGYAQEKGLLWRSLCLVDKELIEIRLFLAYASFKDFVVYQMDVKSAFLYGKIEEEVSQGCRHSQWKSKALLKDEDGEEVDGFYCKKQTVVANSTTEVEYVAASSCYLLSKAFDRKAKKSVKLMMKKLFRMELELCCNQSNARYNYQCWVKTINGEAQLHALVDGKKIIVTESSVRRDLQLADEEGVDCLPNSTIFEQLTLMGPKTTAWNEFSSTMASAIICLATNQKFNFSKFIFESMIRNLDNLSGKFLMYPRHNNLKLKRKDTQVPQPSDPIENVADEAVHKELGDSLVRAATTASSLEAEQDSGNINKTQSKATPNESSSLRTTSGGGLRCQEIMGDTIAQTRFENVSKHSNDSVLARGFLILRDKGPLKIYEIVVLKRIESSDYEESLGEDASKQRELLPLIQIDINYPVSTAGDATTVSAVTTTATITTIDDITLAQALMEIKSTKPKEKGDKGKGILIELVKPMRRKILSADEEATLKLQAEFDEEERLAREKAEKEKEANIALIETWDDIQAKIDVDHQLAERLQAQEQEELSIKEKATLFQQLLEKRRKHFAAKRAEEKRNKPPTKAQQRKIMCTYLKNMEGYKLKDLKLKEFDSIQEMFAEHSKGKYI